MEIMKLVPNALSAFRVFAGLCILGSAITGWWSVTFFLIVAGYVSDLIDGPIARKFNAVSPNGQTIDLYADIFFDLMIVMGLTLTEQLGWWAIPLALVIVIIRLPAFMPRFYKLGTILLPIWGCGMAWSVGTYVLKAFGAIGLQTILILVVPTIIVVAVLKRERIIRDIKTFLTTFFPK